MQILSEKYILTEKYVLDESSDFVNSLAEEIKAFFEKNYSEEILKSLDNIALDDGKNKEASADLKSIVQSAKELKDQIDSNAGDDNIDRQIKDFFKKFSDFGKSDSADLAKYPTLRDIDADNDQFEVGTDHDKLVSLASTYLETIISAIPEDQLKENGAKLSDVDKLQKDIPEVISTLDKIKDDAEEAYELFYTSLLNSLKANLPEPLIVMDQSKDISVLTDSTNVNVEQTNANIAELINACETFTTAYANKAKQKVGQAVNSEKQDWDARYKACQSNEDFEKFWQDYYQTEWGKDGATVDSLGYSFIQEVQNLGFNAITNPFIAFLKESNRISDFKIDAAHYVELHNAAASGELSAKADLKGTGTFGKLNVIFCRELWTAKTALQMRQYLEMQEKLGDEGYRITGWSGNEAAILGNIFYANGDQENLTNGSIIGDAANYKLRETQDIQKIMQSFMPDSDTDKKSGVSDDTLTKRLEKFTKETAVKAIVYLFVFFKQTAYTQLDKLYKTDMNIQTIIDSVDRSSISYQEQNKIDRDLGLLTTKYTPRQITEMLKKLSEIAQGTK